MNEVIGLEEVDYETKSVVFKDPDDGTKFTIMVTKFHGGGKEHLNDVGFGGQTVLFTVLSSNTMMTDYNVYRLIREHMMLPDSIKPFLTGIERGVKKDPAFGIGWNQLKEGFVYTPSFVDGML